MSHSITSFFLIRLAVFLFGVAFLLSCSSKQPPLDDEIEIPSKKPELGLLQQFNEAIVDYYRKGGNEELLNEIITNQRGTKFANYSYLLLGDSYFQRTTSADLQTAKTYYKIFLDSNRSFSPLVPYVLSQMIAVDYLLNESKLFVKYTDLAPYKSIIDNYNKFYFLYPNSVYFEQVSDILGKSVQKLAKIEHNIADWYQKKQLFAAALNRYALILKNHPEYEKSDAVLEEYLSVLEKNNQTDKVLEIADAIKKTER